MKGTVQWESLVDVKHVITKGQYYFQNYYSDRSVILHDRNEHYRELIVKIDYRKVGRSEVTRYSCHWSFKCLTKERFNCQFQFLRCSTIFISKRDTAIKFHNCSDANRSVSVLVIVERYFLIDNDRIETTGSLIDFILHLQAKKKCKFRRKKHCLRDERM